MAFSKIKTSTIFRKYMAVNLLTVITSFLILGCMLMVFMSNYWKQDKVKTLERNTQSIVAIMQNNIITSADTVYVTNVNVMKEFISTFSKSSNADIFVVDADGNILLFSEVSGQSLSSDSIPQQTLDQILDQAAQGSYFSLGKMNGFYDDNCFIVAQPVFYINDTSYQNPIAFVISASSINHLQVFISDALKMFFIAAVAAMLLSFVIITLINYKTVKPLRQMADAVKSFGQGDFSKRVPVVSSDEIGQLAVEFNNMAQSLSTSEVTRRSFIANVSHELKTPMTTIAGFIDGILDGTIPSNKQNYYLNIVSQEIKRLSRLVKTMLSLSRIDNGELKISCQRFDLTSMLVKCLLTFEASLDKKHITISGLDDANSIFVYGDPDMLYQVIYNLIENAVKFVNDSGQITFFLERKNDNVICKIRNTGDGIAPEDLALVFDKFYKTDKSRSMDKNGMGLGLYIVRQIIRLHGGNITVNSIQGEYCEFEFWIPNEKGRTV